MKHNRINRLMCSLLVCSMLFAFSTLVFAEDKSELVQDMKSASLVKRGPMPTALRQKHSDFKVVIEKLVEEGKLSREKAVEIHKFVQQKREELKNLKPEEQANLRKGQKYELVKDLVDAKIINDAEAEMIRGKFRAMIDAALNEKLTAMVQKGTITQVQADKVKVYFENARKVRVEMHKQLQNMTEEQRNAFFKEYKKDNLMDKLVEDGVLTKEQFEELRNSFKEGHKGKCKDH